MAEEIKKVISVDVTGAVSSLEKLKSETEDTGQTFSSLGEAKKYIDKLKASLIDLDQESSEYLDICNEIRKMQDKVSSAMRAADKEVDGATGSYNALSKQMSELKKQWRATSDEVERDALGRQIVEINDKLKDLDASIGNYQRNVGNYASAFTQGLKDIASKVKALNSPLLLVKRGVRDLNGAFKTLAGNPVGVALLAVLGAIKAIKNGFDSSEKATRSLKKGFAAFEPIVNGIKNAFSRLAEGIGGAVEKFGNFVTKVGSFFSKDYADKVAESNKLVEREQKLVDKTREYEIEISKINVDVANLRSKAAEKDIYTLEQRQGFLEEAINKEIEIADKEEELAKEQMEIAKVRAEQTANNAEDNEYLTRTQVEYNNTVAECVNKRRELKAQLAEINLQLEKEEDNNDGVVSSTESVTDAVIDETDAVNKLNKEIALSLMSDRDAALTKLSDWYEEQKALLERNGQDITDLTRSYEKQRQEIILKYEEQMPAEVTNILREVQLAMMTEEEQELFILDEKYKRELELLQEWGQDTVAYTEQYMQQRQEIINRYNPDNTTDTTTTSTVSEPLTGAGSLKAGDNPLIGQWDADLVATTNYVDATTSLLSDLSSAWGDYIEQRLEAGEITEEQAEKEFETNKKLQISMAWISGLTGAIQAYSTAMELGPVAGPIVGAINAAAVIATTALQVQKIKATTLGSGGTGGSVTPTETATSYTPDYTTNVTGSSDSVSLVNAIKEGQSSTKVYVLESDIETVRNKVQVRESETTF